MKKLKLFPKIFIYTLALLLLITTLASGTIYLLAPMMGENSVLSEGTYVDGMSSAIKTAASGVTFKSASWEPKELTKSSE